MRIVVVGKGGREHALLRSLSESPGEIELFCFPGSDAISGIAQAVEADGLQELVAWMKAHSIDLCVAGEESYLLKDEGLANLCAKHGIPCWGPAKEAALLEGSKEFAKQFMERHGIPTGRAVVVESAEEAREVIGKSYPTVLKFDGLAAGKGVAVCPDEESVSSFLEEVYGQRRFGEGSLLIEEYLEGPEVSIFAAVSGREAVIFTPARDYKLIGEGDTGANTGGMGAVASRQLIDPVLMDRIEKEIIEPTIEGLADDDLGYVGFLYFGLMLTTDGPKIIEYNCRFGDPECQAVMPLVSGNLAAFCREGAEGKLRPELLSFDEGWSVGVILASAGYPASSHSGDVIDGLDDVDGVRVYHSGTRLNAEGQWETNGGRVLAVVARGADRETAVTKAHLEAAKIEFEGSQHRSDIGRLHFE